MGFLKNLFGVPKPPKVPSATDTASTAARYNLDAQRTNLSANRLDQTTPYGSVNYTQTGTDPYGNPTYGVNTSLSPEQQSLLTTLQGNQGQLGTTAASLIGDTTGRYSTAPDFSEQAGSQVRTMMDRQLGYLSPYYTQQRENLESQLRNQGLQPGTVAYDRALRTLTQNQDQSIGAWLNTVQPIAFNQAIQQYEQPLNTIQKLLGMSQPASNLMLQTPPSVSMNPVDYSGIQKQSQDALNQQYQQQMAQSAGLINAIGGGLSAFMGAPGSSLLGRAGGGLANFLGLPPATTTPSVTA